MPATFNLIVSKLFLHRMTCTKYYSHQDYIIPHIINILLVSQQALWVRHFLFWEQDIFTLGWILLFCRLIVRLQVTMSSEEKHLHYYYRLGKSLARKTMKEYKKWNQECAKALKVLSWWMEGRIIAHSW